MDVIRSAWRRGGEWVFGEQSRLPTRDEHVAVADSLMAELDFHVKEVDRLSQETEREKQREERGGVDYSWLMVKVPKGYEIPQLERLELEELCLKVALHTGVGLDNDRMIVIIITIIIVTTGEVGAGGTLLEGSTAHWCWSG